MFYLKQMLFVRQLIAVRPQILERNLMEKKVEKQPSYVIGGRCSYGARQFLRGNKQLEPESGL